MILSMMVYAACIAALLGLFALVGERIFAELSLPRRGIWAFALVASMAMPAYAVLAAPNAADASLFSLPFTIELDALPQTAGAAVADSVGPRWTTWLASRGLDEVLLGLWGAASGLALLALAQAALALRKTAMRLETRTIDGEEVLLDDRLGPAVFGFVRPRIVLPRWLAEGDGSLRTFVLAHEREHIAARDQVLLLGAVVLVAAMPWNIGLWWQLRRLRAAIEVDCDSRVLRDCTDVGGYSEALLSVRLGRPSAPFGAVALIEPVSDLERRIRIMLEEHRTLSLSGLGGRIAVALSIFGLALAVNAPNAQLSTEPAAESPRRVHAMRKSVYELLSRAQSCAEEEDLACAREALEEVSRIHDLNDYEIAQMWYFRAFIDFTTRDMPRSVAAYENVLRLSDIPEGLRQNTMLSLSQLYISGEQYQQGLEMLDEWLALQSAPSPQAYLLRAQAEYQLGRYDQASGSVERAIAVADEPFEGAYKLRMAIQLEQEDYAGAVETLELLNSRWPSDERARQLEHLRAEAAN